MPSENSNWLWGWVLVMVLNASWLLYRFATPRSWRECFADLKHLVSEECETRCL